MNTDEDTKAQALILAGIFVLVAIIIGGFAYIGFTSGNIPLGILSTLGEGAWFFAGRYIIGG